MQCAGFSMQFYCSLEQGFAEVSAEACSKVHHAALQSLLQSLPCFWQSIWNKRSHIFISPQHAVNIFQQKIITNPQNPEQIFVFHKSPAELTIFSCLFVDLTLLWPPADVGAGCLVLDGSSEECSTGVTTDSSIMNVSGGLLPTNLEQHKNIK